MDPSITTHRHVHPRLLCRYLHTPDGIYFLGGYSVWYLGMTRPVIQIVKATIGEVGGQVSGKLKQHGVDVETYQKKGIRAFRKVVGAGGDDVIELTSSLKDKDE